MLFTALLTLHLIGLALGLGGATIGDITVLRSLRRNDPAPIELLRVVSNAIWVGLATLGASGAGLFALHPSAYLHNSGFQAKMLVVAALVANGVFLHTRLPTLRMTHATLLSGAISTVSWGASVVIAVFKDDVRMPLVEYMGLYAFLVLIVWISYLKTQRHLRQRIIRRLALGLDGVGSFDAMVSGAVPTTEQWDLTDNEIRVN